MAPQLPWELEEHILFRLPPQSLVRFRTVCQRRYALFKDKSFLNNHLFRFRHQFIVLADSKNYSIDIINPTIELHELPSSAFSYQDLHLYCTTIKGLDELLFCNDRYGNGWSALWNPWSSLIKLIKNDGRKFVFLGLGYDISRPEKVYMILGYFDCLEDEYKRVAIYECASHVFKFVDTPDKNGLSSETAKVTNVSLNGNLYWFTRNVETDEYFIRSFDFSVDNFKPFCLLPCQKDNTRDELLLAVFKRDQFSLLKLCEVTGKIEIWVTNKIDKEEVVWRKLMTLPTTNFPTLYDQFYRTSYFIYDKILLMCCGYDKNGVACIYIVREDLCKKIQIDSGIFIKCCHCVYTPLPI